MNAVQDWTRYIFSVNSHSLSLPTTCSVCHFAQHKNPPRLWKACRGPGYLSDHRRRRRTVAHGLSHVIPTSEQANWHRPDRSPTGLGKNTVWTRASPAAGPPATRLVYMNEPLCTTAVITPAASEYVAAQLRLRCACKLIMTLLFEVDVVLLPKPGVGQVAGIRFCLAGEQCILGDVDSDVFRRSDDVWRP